MRVLLFDPFHGAAGDMILGALLDAGADQELVKGAMASVAGEPVITRVKRKGIEGVHVDTGAESSRRTFGEVISRVRDASAPKTAKDRAERIFHRIRQAEERVHGESVHFHEVGADDAIAEVIGACVALESLKIDRCEAMPLAVGSGYVRTDHGLLPVPAPATLEILRDSTLKVRGFGGEGELLTPTGAAILAEFCAAAIGPPVNARILAIGWGAGSRETEDAPNLLRAILMEEGGAPGQDLVDLLETNLDDATPEVIGNALALLMQEGALDAGALPLTMKKGRPACMIRVIAHPSRSEHLAMIMARELGTLGIRALQGVHRIVVERTTEEVEVELLGCRRRMALKCGWRGGELLTVKPEFEECRKWAEELHLPVRRVIRAAEEAGWRAMQQRIAGDQ